MIVVIPPIKLKTNKQVSDLKKKIINQGKNIYPFGKISLTFFPDWCSIISSAKKRSSQAFFWKRKYMNKLLSRIEKNWLIRNTYLYLINEKIN